MSMGKAWRTKSSHRLCCSPDCNQSTCMVADIKVTEADEDAENKAGTGLKASLWWLVLTTGAHTVSAGLCTSTEMPLTGKRPLTVCCSGRWSGSDSENRWREVSGPGKKRICAFYTYPSSWRSFFLFQGSVLLFSSELVMVMTLEYFWEKE